MQHIGVLYNPQSSESVRIATALTAFLQNEGRRVWCGTSPEAPEQLADLDKLELLIALGGDGTVLRAARLAIPYDIPILTVALGRLNFLAELVPNDLYHGVQQVLNHQGWFDHRSLIQVTVHRDGHTLTEYTALNEVILSRGDISRILTVDVQIDGIPLTTYRADGVMIATATGSSAYALSAGGPIVDPRSQALVLVPVAAHLTAIPSMVLHEDSVVTFGVHCCHHATLAVDGRENLPMYENDTVQICRSSKRCTFVRVHPPSQFYASLVRRLRRE